MKKIPLISAFLMILTLTLTACTGNAQTGKQAASAILTEDYANAASVEEQLIIGTIRLEETEQAVNTEQATKLIQFWQLLKNLKNQDSTAQQEIIAVIEKIESIMTADQLKIIADMKITQQDAMSVMQGQVDSTSKGTVTQGNNSFPGGPPPDAIGGMPGPGAVPNQSATATTATGKTSANSSLSSLMDTLIQLLQKKVLA